MAFESFSHAFETPVLLGRDGIKAFSSNGEATFLEVVPRDVTRQEEAPLFSMSASDTAQFLSDNGIRNKTEITRFPSVKIGMPPESGVKDSPWAERLAPEKIVMQIRISNDDAMDLYALLHKQGKLTDDQKDTLQGHTLQVIDAAREREQAAARQEDLDIPAYLRKKDAPGQGGGQSK
jgi:hypothetical protein